MSELNLYCTIYNLRAECAERIGKLLGERSSTTNLALEAKIAGAEAEQREYDRCLETLAEVYGQSELLKQYQQGLLTPSELRYGMLRIQRSLELTSYTQQEADLLALLNKHGKAGTF